MMSEQTHYRVLVEELNGMCDRHDLVVETTYVDAIEGRIAELKKCANQVPITYIHAMSRLEAREAIVAKLPKYKDTGAPFIPLVDTVYVRGTNGVVEVAHEMVWDGEWYCLYSEAGMPTLMTTRRFFSTPEAAQGASDE